MTFKGTTYYARVHRARARSHRSSLIYGTRIQRLRRQRIVLIGVLMLAFGLWLLWATRSSSPPTDTKLATTRIPTRVKSTERPIAAERLHPATPELRLAIALSESTKQGSSVYCALFDETGWPFKPKRTDVAKVDSRHAACSFPNLTPGRYAAAAFYDENGNNDLDRDWFGMPKEPWALSRGVRPKFPVPPDFGAVSFNYSGGTLVRHLNLEG